MLCADLADACMQVDFNAKNEYDMINNYKVMQDVFNKLGVEKVRSQRGASTTPATTAAIMPCLTRQRSEDSPTAVAGRVCTAGMQQKQRPAQGADHHPSPVPRT